ncbi:ABC transporter substrate-binding protein [Phreatobacter aquaticus]|uniref:ABC transporter substrate-binding protein n=1 Tax=Phreatobacter aquaticus TaxID=2570229 RepID=A0A4D7QIJ6_9HYPH|nr:ABC transporter substrate-binding protein [Phreatobacter aquaticus]QCK86855.1 ABC transporter substrate-binding protein [Phreatobacter aquaticus]
MTFSVTRRTAIAAVAGSVAAPALGQQARDRFVFGTNWLPDVERGGFYHAEAAGIFRKYGLDVTIQAGGPQLNNPQLLVAGRLDGVMISSSIEALNYAHSDVPLVTVAAIYQKSPQILVAHAASGVKSLEDLRGKPILISGLARNGYWRWLKAKYGYTDDQIRPYTFNLGPFVANPQAIQQGFITYEPNQVRQAGIEPVVFLFADHGFNDFGGIITMRRETLETRRDVAQRFVQAVSEGWRDFLFGDPAPGLALIKSVNDRLTDEIIANSLKVIKERELIHGGEGRRGIGFMTAERWAAIYETMASSEIVPRGDYWRRAFDTSLLGTGLALPPA